MTNKQLPLQDDLRKMFDYDASTGLLRWRENGARRASWNTRFCGKIAGCKTTIGYWQIYINNAPQYAHRIIWVMHKGDIPDGMMIDHANGRTTDNRIENLRLCTKAQNAWNAKRPKTNTSGVKGVRFHEATGKWIARIKVDGASRHIGLFDDKEDAIRAYSQTAIRTHGEFVRFK